MLVDGRDAFLAFAGAMARARQAIYIAGWDIHSRTRLFPGASPPHGLPEELGPFLSALAARNRELHIHVLTWNYASIYALEREPLPALAMGWRTHRRVHFRLDGDHPAGACQHQKLLIVDDAVAFSGGLDLTINRWDTPRHRARDPRRTLPSGRPYGPFHDVQMAVDGDAARDLAILFRRRWRRATGRSLRAPEAGRDPWPESLAPDLEGVRVAIARTLPAHRGRAEVREVERLYLDSIRAARRSLYIENQYVTSTAIQEALAARLEEADGPEVVIVSPLKLAGWLEESTMGMLRSRLIRGLRAADRHGRLRVLHPAVEGNADPGVNVHSKVLFMDEEMVRVGSANLSNRSMGLDSECDLAIEARGDEGLRRRIGWMRARLIGEHLGRSPGAIDDAVRECGSLIAGLERCGGGSRSLRPIDPQPEDWAERVVPGRLVDPERPIGPDDLLETFDPQRPAGGRRLAVAGAAGFLALIGLAVTGALTGWSFLGAVVDPRSLLGGGSAVPAPLAPLVVAGCYLLAGLLLLPVTLLIVETAILFGPWLGFVYALGGSLVSAVAFYLAGRALGPGRVRRLPGRWLDRVARWISRRGIMAVVVARLLPLAPFTIVNLMAGAARIRFRDFVLGTLLGMTPGIALMTILGDQLGRTLRQATLSNVLLLVLAAAAAILAGWGVQKVLPPAPAGAARARRSSRRARPAGGAAR